MFTIDINYLFIIIENRDFHIQIVNFQIAVFLRSMFNSL